jgi:hypothetical protein
MQTPNVTEFPRHLEPIASDIFFPDAPAMPENDTARHQPHDSRPAQVHPLGRPGPTDERASVG